MNSKILLAFLGGAVLASGIVYLAVQEPPPPTKRVLAAAKPIYVSPPPEIAPAPLHSPVVSAEAVRELPGDPPADRPMKKARAEKRSSVTGVRQVEMAQVTKPALAVPIPAEIPPTIPPTVTDNQPSAVSSPLQQASPQVAPAPAPELPKEAPPVLEPPPPTPATQPHTVTLTAGTLLPVRIGETLTANRNQPGDSFLATLDQPLVVDGFVIAERGARLVGRIVEADLGGRVRGSSHLGVELVKLSTADGQHVRIRTSAFEKQSESSLGTDAAKIGVGAAIGAAIGGMAGGGKGAGIGAGVGGAAGASDVLLTHGKAASIPVETRISFRLQEPVTITERLQ